MAYPVVLVLFALAAAALYRRGSRLWVVPAIAALLMLPLLFVALFTTGATTTGGN